MKSELSIFNFQTGRLSYWSSATHSWLIEPVKFDIWAGGDSNASLHTEFQLP
jgi:beta-glucosidase